MIFFLDTEFTDVLVPELLSLGLVTLHGCEPYVELNLSNEAGKGRVIYETPEYYASGFGILDDLARGKVAKVNRAWSSRRPAGQLATLG